VEEHAGDRVVIAFAVRVHAADALVVAADDLRKLDIEVDGGPPKQQPRGRSEMRFMSPIGPRQRARQQLLADALDIGG